MIFSIRQQLAQHVLQNATVTVIVQLRRRVDAADHFELGRFAVVRRSFDRQFLAQFQIGANTEDVELFKSGQPVASLNFLPA